MPIFPLNTDGIDPAGRNIYIHNISVTNFDDVVAIKPRSASVALKREPVPCLHKDAAQPEIIERNAMSSEHTSARQRMTVVQTEMFLGLVGSSEPGEGKYANCSENILVEDVSVKFGVGP